MKIALNLSFVVPGETGGSEIYVRCLVPELARLVGADSLTLFASPELAAEMRATPWFECGTVVTVRAPGRSRVRRSAAEQLLLPLAVRRARVDVLHNMASTAPAWSGAQASVTTILDLIYLHYPAAHSRLLAGGMGMLVPLAARRSDRIIAISHATKDDLVASLGIDPIKIDVVHLGPGPGSDAEPTPEVDLRRRLGLGDAAIVVSPSARRAHKNLERLLDAFALVDDPSQPTLVLPGYATGVEDALVTRARQLGLADRVVFCGWLSDADLAGLYASATALVFPSLYEGFGLPVLEAMRRGLPVACSERSSLPEIAGDAALLFDPESVRAIAEAITRLLSDAELRARLSDAGPRRAADFTWERAALDTLASYERALAAAR